MAKKAKIGELDIVRGIAILAVVLIHTTSEGSSYELMGRSKTQLLYFFINKMCAFAVPLFILVSGLVLFYVYIDNWNAKKLGVFYFKRVRSVIIPYLLWSLFYYLYDQWLVQPKQVTFNWSKFLDLLPWADAKYHLYFMIIIVQFYVLFPPLLMLARKWAWFRGGGLPILGMLIQAGFYSYSHWVHPLDHRAELCVSYFSFFAFGGFLGIYYARARAFIERHMVWLLPVGVLFGLVYTGMFILNEYSAASFGNTWYEAFWALYGLSSGVVSIGVALWLLRSSMSVAALLTSLGVTSYGVYFMHPAVLTTWKLRVPAPGSVLGYNLYSFAGFLLTLLVPWIATLVYKRIGGLMRRRST